MLHICDKLRALARLSLNVGRKSSSSSACRIKNTLFLRARCSISIVFGSALCLICLLLLLLLLSAPDLIWLMSELEIHCIWTTMQTTVKNYLAAMYLISIHPFMQKNKQTKKTPARQHFAFHSPSVINIEGKCIILLACQPYYRDRSHCSPSFCWMPTRQWMHWWHFLIRLPCCNHV